MNVDQSVAVAMRKTNDIFCSKVIQAQAFQALAQVYTENARLLPPGGEMVTGRPGIIAFWSAAIPSLKVQSATLTTLEVESTGDSVIEIGKAKLTVENGEVVIAKYVIQWKQEDNSWKWHIDIWNSDI